MCVCLVLWLIVSFCVVMCWFFVFFFFQAEDGIRDDLVTGVQTCALPILLMVALPSVLYGRWIKDKVYLQTDSVGKVEFSHYTHMAIDRKSVV